MKKFLLIFMGLLLGLNCIEAQTSQTSKLIKTWVLQNPESAVIYQVMTLYANGQVLQQYTNLLTNEKVSVQLTWKFDAKNRVLTLTASDGNSASGDILLTDNTLTIMNSHNEIDYIFAESGSGSDHYMERVKTAVGMYGSDASLKKNGFPSSSRETGYSFQPRYSPCPSCLGTGRCTNCHGSGVVTYNYSDYNTCPSCGGTGVCWQCHGKGKIQNY